MLLINVTVSDLLLEWYYGKTLSELLHILHKGGELIRHGCKLLFVETLAKRKRQLKIVKSNRDSAQRLPYVARVICSAAVLTPRHDHALNPHFVEKHPVI